MYQHESEPTNDDRAGWAAAAIEIYQRHQARQLSRTGAERAALATVAAETHARATHEYGHGPRIDDEESAVTFLEELMASLMHYADGHVTPQTIRGAIGSGTRPDDLSPQGTAAVELYAALADAAQMHGLDWRELHHRAQRIHADQVEDEREGLGHARTTADL